jgi:hypothetical protein
MTDGDFNADGKADVVVADASAGVLKVALGNGNGTFHAFSAFGRGGSLEDVAAADLNGDDKTDLVAANDADGTLDLFLANGNGTFLAPVSFATGGGAFSVRAADVNRDGVKDLIAANSSGAAVTRVFLGNGNGTYAASISQQYGATQLADVQVHDVDLDGYRDLIVVDQGRNAVAVAFGNGNGSFKAAATYAAVSNPQSVTVGDFDGNGGLDLAIAAKDTNQVIVRNNAGGGTAGDDGDDEQPLGRASRKRPKPKDISSLFGSDANLLSAGGAYQILQDLKALKKQIENNREVLQYARDFIQQNVSLVQATSNALLTTSGQIRSADSADSVAAAVRNQIVADARGALTQANNLEAIAVASLLFDGGEKKS